MGIKTIVALLKDKQKHKGYKYEFSTAYFTFISNL